VLALVCINLVVPTLLKLQVNPKMRKGGNRGSGKQGRRGGKSGSGRGDGAGNPDGGGKGGGGKVDPSRLLGVGGRTRKSKVGARVGKTASSPNIEEVLPTSPGVRTRRGAKLQEKTLVTNDPPREAHATGMDKQKPQQPRETPSPTPTVEAEIVEDDTTIKASNEAPNFMYLSDFEPPTPNEVEYAKTWKAKQIGKVKDLPNQEASGPQQDVPLEAKDELTSSIVSANVTDTTPLPSKQSSIESTSKTEYPLLKNLSETALLFVLQVMGRNELPAKRHISVELNSFCPLMLSFPKFLTAAGAKRIIGSVSKFSLKLRYFGGLCIDPELGKMSRKPMDSNVSKILLQFITSQFNHRDHSEIEKCIAKSRSMYITASSLSGSKETIVACINFGVIGNVLESMSIGLLPLMKLLLQQRTGVTLRLSLVAAHGESDTLRCSF